MEIDGNLLEELGFKADKKGLFQQWQSLRIELNKDDQFPVNDAAEKAFQKLAVL